LAALVDTHLHLYRDEFEGEREAVRARARAAGVAAFVHIGYDRTTNEAAQAIAQEDDASFSTAGVHPHDAARYDDDVEERMRELGRAGRIVAIGECGLDYFRDLSPRDAQDRAFRRQITLAKELDLPMIHHVRDAYPQARAVLEEEGVPPRGGIFHAFAGDAEFARWAVDHGYRLGIGGVFTYKKSHLAEAISGLPLRALQLETDAPWLPPQPWRGRRNEPAFARYVADAVASAFGVSIDHAANVWAHDFETLFRVRLPARVWEIEPSGCPPPGPDGSPVRS
jgi:TatD DNase family protein